MQAAGLVLVPTRELASQVQAVLAPLAESVGLSVATIFGGVPQRPQVAKLRARADIVVACPGRLADLIEQGHCHLGDVEVSVLDEADHMADLGFLPVVRRLLDMTPADGQRMLFSATLDAAVDVLARRFMHRPVQHEVGAVEAPVTMVHHLLTVDAADRLGVLAALTGGSTQTDSIYAPASHPSTMAPASSRWEGPEERALDQAIPGTDQLAPQGLPAVAPDSQDEEVRRLNGGN